jgi:hypothetical protein
MATSAATRPLSDLDVTGGRHRLRHEGSRGVLTATLGFIRQRRLAVPVLALLFAVGSIAAPSGLTISAPFGRVGGSSGESSVALGAHVSAPLFQETRPRAGLVVALPDGTVIEHCVALGGAEANGIELLQRAGIQVGAWVTPLGSMVCSLDGQGCAYPAESCLCECRFLGSACEYWAYHTLEDGRWQYAVRGAADRKVRHGDVDGWAWGRGSLVEGTRPPLRTFDAICGLERRDSDSSITTPNPEPPRHPGVTSTPPAGAASRVGQRNARAGATATTLAAGMAHSATRDEAAPTAGAITDRHSAGTPSIGREGTTDVAAGRGTAMVEGSRAALGEWSTEASPGEFDRADRSGEVSGEAGTAGDAVGGMHARSRVIDGSDRLDTQGRRHDGPDRIDSQGRAPGEGGRLTAPTGDAPAGGSEDLGDGTGSTRGMGRNAASRAATDDNGDGGTNDLLFAVLVATLMLAGAWLMRRPP